VTGPASSFGRSTAAAGRLVLFDLDHTLLDADTDVLWCGFLIGEGLLDRAAFEARNAAMEQGYRAGTVTAAAFSGFYLSTLADRLVVEIDALRRRFVAREVLPRMKPAALECLSRHQRRGDRVILTTATSRVLTEPTAEALGIDELIATEAELETTPAGPRYTGRPVGTLNMREGKVERLRAWLDPADANGAGRTEPRADAAIAAVTSAVFYSDSANDLPLLQAVGHAVAVDPDGRLRQAAALHRWPVYYWRR
jgi:HAD superfamily hydrolase (TIGR01490 family)